MRKSLIATVLALSLLFSIASVVMASPLTPVQISTPAFSDNLIKTAESYQGKVKYVFGVRDLKHLILDCSSFTQLVFGKNGVYIPWGSNAQTHYGTPVKNKANLQKGDLVMFSVHTPGRINHVGIYIGNGKFIENIPKYGVVIADLNSKYWSMRFITGRHITK